MKTCMLTVGKCLSKTLPCTALVSDLGENMTFEFSSPSWGLDISKYGGFWREGRQLAVFFSSCKFNAHLTTCIKKKVQLLCQRGGPDSPLLNIQRRIYFICSQFVYRLKRQRKLVCRPCKGREEFPRGGNEMGHWRMRAEWLLWWVG